MKKYFSTLVPLILVFVLQPALAQGVEQMTKESKARLNLDLLFSPDPIVGVDLDYKGSEEFVHFSVLDEEGHVLIDEKKSSKQKPDLSELIPGIYYIVIHGEDRKLSFRFEKKIDGDKAS